MKFDARYVDDCFLKCRRVIYSCKTLEQFRSASNYVHYFFQMFFNCDTGMVCRMDRDLARHFHKVMGSDARMY